MVNGLAIIAGYIFRLASNDLHNYMFGYREVRPSVRVNYAKLILSIYGYNKYTGAEYIAAVYINYSKPKNEQECLIHY